MSFPKKFYRWKDTNEFSVNCGKWDEWKPLNEGINEEDVLHWISRGKAYQIGEIEIKNVIGYEAENFKKEYNMKHTPGPWAILPEEVDKDYIRIRGTRCGSRYKIANVVTPTYPGFSTHEDEETRANARLIAAAPELFEVLHKAIETLEGEGINALDGTTVQDARNLINEIEGF